MHHSAFAKAIRLPLRLIPKLKPLPILSGPLAGKRWLSTSGTHGCWLGTYESELQRLLVENLRPGDVLYDVGANVGFFSLLASHLVGTGSVVAFEPLPANLDLLKKNLALNGVGNVSIVEAAVADTNGTARFALGQSSSQGMLADTGIEVRLVSLDQLDLPPPTAMKIDVEGAESRVLAGAAKLLSNYRPLIFLSTHGYLQHEACTAPLEGMGYRLTLWRDGAMDGQYESVARRNHSSAARTPD